MDLSSFLGSVEDHAGQALFLSVALVTFLYVITTKRRVDFLSLSYFGAAIYFMPGFWGFTYYLNSYNQPIYVPISQSAYLIMAIVLGIIAVGIKLCRPYEIHFTPSRSVSTQYWSLLVLTTGSLVMLYVQRGAILSAPDKMLILEEYSSKWLTLFETGALATIVTALYSGNRRYLFLALLAAPVDLYLGFRVVTAFAGAAFMYTYLGDKGRLRLFTQWRLALFLLSLLYGALLYKQFIYATKAHDTSLLLRLVNDGSTYSLAIIHSEPFVVVNTLNVATETPFALDFSYVWTWPLALIPFLPSVGLDLSDDFIRQFQSVILPGLSYGIGGNPWAELYLMGSLPLVILGALGYVAVLRLISRYAAHSRFSTVQIASISVGSIWCFYFNRNEIFFQLNMTRNAVFMCAAGWVISRWWPGLRTRIPISRKSHGRNQIGRPTPHVGQAPSRVRAQFPGRVHQ